MTADPIDEQTITPLVTPMQAVARAVARLAEEKIIPDELTLHRAADAVGVPVRMVRYQQQRLAIVGYTPPLDVLPAADPKGDYRYRPPSPEPPLKWGRVTEDRGPLPRWPTWDEATDADVRKCPMCHQALQLKAHFKWMKSYTRKSTGEVVYRWSGYCNACNKKYQRERYLSTAKREALEKAQVTFVVREEDLLDTDNGDGSIVELACACCGELIRAGDRVQGSTILRHEACIPADG